MAGSMAKTVSTIVVKGLMVGKTAYENSCTKPPVMAANDLSTLNPAILPKIKQMFQFSIFIM